MRAPDCNCPEQIVSRDGKKAMELFESSCKLLDGRYVIGLPWKKDPVNLPNNYPVAKRRQRVCGPLLPEEIELAESYWIKSAQSKLEDWKDRYRDLAPYEKDGIIRVGGRLTQSPLSYDENHPMLLPADHVISKLVVKDSHNRVFHAGRERNS